MYRRLVVSSFWMNLGIDRQGTPAYRHRGHQSAEAIDDCRPVEKNDRPRHPLKNLPSDGSEKQPPL
jgi:hypothetical protein